MKRALQFIGIVLICATPLFSQQVISARRRSVTGTPPTYVQQCTTSIGGGGASSFTITIASAGTTNCTTPFTSGDMLSLDYTSYAPAAVADWTTAMMSQTGATITWHKAGSGLDSSGTFYDGTLYACSGDISGATSSIAITLTPGGSSTFSAVTIKELKTSTATACLDQFVTLKTGALSPSPIVSNTSSTLGTALEFANVVARTSTTPGNLTAGSCFGGTCTLPHTTSNPDIDFNSEYFITSATTAGTGAFGSTAGLLYSVHIALFK